MDVGLKVCTDGLAALGGNTKEGTAYISVMTAMVTLLVAMSIAFALGAYFMPWANGNGAPQQENANDPSVPWLRYRWSARGSFTETQLATPTNNTNHTPGGSSSLLISPTHSEQIHLAELTSEDLRNEVKQLSALVSRDFIESWFHEIISLDTSFICSLCDKLQDAVANLALRVLHCDMVALMFLDVAEAFRRLYGSFTDARTQVLKDHPELAGPAATQEILEARQKHIIRLLNVAGVLHPACSSSPNATKETVFEEHQTYLRQVFDPVVSKILPDSAAACDTVQLMCREVVVCKVIQPLLTLVTPAFITKHLLTFMEEATNLEAENVDVDVDEIIEEADDDGGRASIARQSTTSESATQHGDGDDSTSINSNHSSEVTTPAESGISIASINYSNKSNNKNNNINKINNNSNSSNHKNAKPKPRPRPPALLSVTLDSVSERSSSSSPSSQSQSGGMYSPDVVSEREAELDAAMNAFFGLSHKPVYYTPRSRVGSGLWDVDDERDASLQRIENRRLSEQLQHHVHLEAFAEEDRHTIEEGGEVEEEVEVDWENEERRRRDAVAFPNEDKEEKLVMNMTQVESGGHEKGGDGSVGEEEVMGDIQMKQQQQKEGEGEQEQQEEEEQQEQEEQVQQPQKHTKKKTASKETKQASTDPSEQDRNDHVTTTNARSKNKNNSEVSAPVDPQLAMTINTFAKPAIVEEGTESMAVDTAAAVAAATEAGTVSSNTVVSSTTTTNSTDVFNSIWAKKRLEVRIIAARMNLTASNKNPQPYVEYVIECGRVGTVGLTITSASSASSASASTSTSTSTSKSATINNSKSGKATGTWSVTRRFRQFHKLQRELKRTEPRAHNLKLPSRQGFRFFATAFDGEFVDKRREKLERYVLALLTQTWAYSNPHVIAFFAPDEATRDMDPMVVNSVLGEGEASNKHEHDQHESIISHTHPHARNGAVQFGTTDNKEQEKIRAETGRIRARSEAVVTTEQSVVTVLSQSDLVIRSASSSATHLQHNRKDRGSKTRFASPSRQKDGVVNDDVDNLGRGGSGGNKSARRGTNLFAKSKSSRLRDVVTPPPQRTPVQVPALELQVQTPEVARNCTTGISSVDGTMLNSSGEATGRADSVEYDNNKVTALGSMRRGSSKKKMKQAKALESKVNSDTASRVEMTMFMVLQEVFLMHEMGMLRRRLIGVAHAALRFSFMRRFYAFLVGLEAPESKTQRLTFLFGWLRELLWPDGKPFGDDDPEEEVEPPTYDMAGFARAQELLVSRIPKPLTSILGKDQAAQSVLVLLELFQYPQLLQHLLFQIVDLAVARLFHRDIIQHAHDTVIRQRAQTTGSEEESFDDGYGEEDTSRVL